MNSPDNKGLSKLSKAKTSKNIDPYMNTVIHVVPTGIIQKNLRTIWGLWEV